MHSIKDSLDKMKSTATNPARKKKRQATPSMVEWLTSPYCREMLSLGKKTRWFQAHFMEHYGKGKSFSTELPVKLSKLKRLLDGQLTIDYGVL